MLSPEAESTGAVVLGGRAPSLVQQSITKTAADTKNEYRCFPILHSSVRARLVCVTNGELATLKTGFSPIFAKKISLIYA